MALSCGWSPGDRNLRQLVSEAGFLASGAELKILVTDPKIANNPAKMQTAPRILRSVLLAISLCFVAAEVAAGAQVPPDLVSFRDNRATYALELSKPIAECVARRDTKNPVFHGCIDWHSAVHGVWALTAYTWATGDDRYRPLIDSLLQASLLTEERKHLDGDPSFEMPYGRAWFLRLAIDFRRAFGANSPLDDFADDIARSLMDFYTKTPPSPTSIAYNSATWALINLYDYGVSRQKPDIVDFVRDKVRAYYVGHHACPLQQTEVATEEFMAVCTNWAWLVGKVLKQDELIAWLPSFLPPGLRLDPIHNPASVHQAGLNFSRAWGLWNLYSRTADPSYLRSYLLHFKETFENTRYWKGDYYEVGHWVPQFGMLAIMVTYYDWR
jgi:hypothetical protein